jgi:hypothetical protein
MKQQGHRSRKAVRLVSELDKAGCKVQLPPMVDCLVEMRIIILYLRQDGLDIRLKWYSPQYLRRNALVPKQMVDVHLSSFACARGTNSNELCRRSRWDHVGEQTLNLLAGRSSSSRVASSDILGRNWTGSWGKYSGGGSDSDRHQTFSCSNSARLFPRLLRIVTLQPSIAPDTLANHALWSFGNTQPRVCSTVTQAKH